MSYEQVSKDLEKVIGYIHSDELTDAEKKTMTEQTLDYFDALIYCESISEGTLDNWHLPDMLNLVLLHTRQREFNMFLAKYQGTFLYDEEYWCKDNSVIDQGVAFNMANSRLAICPKKEKRQVRAILDY